MVQIIKFTHNDDMYGSTDIDIMVCSSINAAKEIILNAANKTFESNFKSLEEVEEKLKEEVDAEWNEEYNKFCWGDNGKGETYIICSINEREVNTNFQSVGTIL